MSTFGVLLNVHLISIALSVGLLTLRFLVALHRLAPCLRALDAHRAAGCRYRFITQRRSVNG